MTAAIMHTLSVAIGLLLLTASTDATRLSSGCGKALQQGLKQGGTGDSNSVYFTTDSGVQRHFLLHLPEVYTPTNGHALIFSFHGRGEDGAEQEAASHLSNHEDNPGHLVVYPDGIDAVWQGDPDATADDVGFTLDLIQNLTSTYCIDEDRIFASGFSNGGGFAANILACHPYASKKIAAFAGLSGAYYSQYPEQGESGCNGATVPIKCNPGRSPIPIFETHGSADPVINYYGGPRRGKCLPTIPHFMTAWAERNGLGSKNVTTSLHNGNVKKYEFGKAAGLEGIDTHYWINGMGHTWPNADDGDYIDATPLLMEFFDKWTLTRVGFGDSTHPSPSHKPSTTSKSSTTSKTSKVSTLTSKPTASPIGASAGSSPVCPQDDNKMYKAAKGDKFKIMCGWDTKSPYFNVVYNLQSFGKCIDTCDQTAGCSHVAYNGACYLKKDSPANAYKKTGNDVNRVAVKV